MFSVLSSSLIFTGINIILAILLKNFIIIRKFCILLIIKIHQIIKSQIIKYNIAFFLPVVSYFVFYIFLNNILSIFYVNNIYCCNVYIAPLMGIIYSSIVLSYAFWKDKSFLLNIVPKEIPLLIKCFLLPLDLLLLLVKILLLGSRIFINLFISHLVLSILTAFAEQLQIQKIFMIVLVFINCIEILNYCILTFVFIMFALSIIKVTEQH